MKEWAGLKSTNDPSDEKVQQACNKIDFKCDAFLQCQYGDEFGIENLLSI